MDTFYHSSETEPLTALTSDFSAESEEPLTLVIDGKIETLEKLINLKSNYSWYSERPTTYCKNGDSNKIPDVFSELNKTVLMVRFTQNQHKKMLWLFISREYDWFWDEFKSKGDQI